MEFFVDITPLENLRIKANYTYTNAIDKSDNSPDKNEALLRRPKNKIGLNINYKFSSRINTNIDIIYAGKRDDKIFTDFSSERIKLDPYTVMDLSATYKLFDYVSLNGRIENLFNTSYEEVYGYATPGISAYAGIKFLF